MSHELAMSSAPHKETWSKNLLDGSVDPSLNVVMFYSHECEVGELWPLLYCYPSMLIENVSSVGL